MKTKVTYFRFVQRWKKWRVHSLFLIFFLSVALNAFGQIKKNVNIVLIVSDDHGTDALGCYGNPVIKTPSLDALASDGIRFTNAFSTVSSCSPSRSVILTGMQNHANAMFGLAHDFHHFSSLDSVKSLPVILSEKGYETIRIGKYHLAPEDVYKFDRVLSKGAANDNSSLARSPVEMAEKCGDIFLAEREKPFFLYFCTDDPHRGLPFNSWPAPNPFGNRKEGYPGVIPTTYDPEDVIVPSFLPDIPECRAELAQYYQSVNRLDQGVGKLIDLLKKAGIYENTLILYISDNGIAFPGVKTTLYDPGTKLPCIVKLPQLKNKGQITDAMISWVDITPTILDYAGILPVGNEFHGRSFKPVLDNPAISQGWDEVYASHSFHEVTMYYPMRVVRTRRYKLIWNIAYKLDYPFAWDLHESTTWKGIVNRGIGQIGKRKVSDFIHRPEFELYDVKDDPDELINLAYNPSYSSILEHLKEKIKDFQKRTNDPWLYKWEYK